jgi:hypothetical protein
MRYSNGFAIGWRTSSSPASQRPKRAEELNG